MARLTPLHRLDGHQAEAANPLVHAALSASAGTGKTHVLTARVLRLLLSGVEPSSILCLTFTKAGAAEMAHRIHERLAHWVRLDEDKLRHELFALGEGRGPDMVGRARTLFAAVLDAPGGGLRIQTIHAFAQALLAAFPAEAGLTPGFRPLERREEQLLARQTLADLLVRAEREGDLGFIRDVQTLSMRMGEGGAEDFLLCCAHAPAAMEELGSREGIEARLRRAFDLPVGDIDAAIEEGCCDERFDLALLDSIAGANLAWGARTGVDCCDRIAAWRAAAPKDRARTLDDLASIVLKKDGEPRAVSAGLLKAAPDYADHAARLAECCRALLRLRSAAALVAAFAAGLRAGQNFAAAYTAAKRAGGLVDFDDLIRWTEQLLSTPGMGEWVRFKLDQRTDHILVDEAQDTNARQWRIIGALAEEYFTDAGAGRRHRTIFTVGDFKQAIFGFQGTDPHEFDQARRYFRKKARALREAEEAFPDFLDLSIDLSFRSSPPVLHLVDRVIAELGHKKLGLLDPPQPHASHRTTSPGSVTLWPPFVVDEGEGDDEEGGEEDWISDATRQFATKLARQIRHWIDHPFEVKGRALRPEDILILVKRRGELASLIVARLYAEGVPVAGVDRLLLSAPLAVQDLLAAARFAMQPLDDLNLAGLLVSPLFGWSQDDLYRAAFGRDGALWPAVRDHPATPAGTLEGLRDILNMADYAGPHVFFETLLSGPLDGRRKLLRRLGAEARDPIEELLASAIAFETDNSPSLQRFLDWFGRGDVEIVRDPSAPTDAVRIMTAHGSKGLQAPVVILADACVDPDRSPGRTIRFQLPEGPCIPIFRPRKDELIEPLKGQIEASDQAERQEHWRLLYVAMTRAEERLYVGGALGARAAKGPPEASWYRAVQLGMSGLGAEEVEHVGWGKALRYGDPELQRAAAVKQDDAVPELPAWLGVPAPVEARPPRPLAPSSLGPDDVADPPPSATLRAAAERGRLLHRLFERLPGVPTAERRERADAWLLGSCGIGDPAARNALTEDACAIIEHPDFAELFGPDALAEAPIAAVIEDGVVVSGTVDRLLVLPGRVLVADFKTGRSAPATIGDIPVAHLRQMAAYRAALRIIFPDRRVETALLYTAQPVLHLLPDALLDAHPLRAAAA